MWLKMMPEFWYKVHVKNIFVKPIIVCAKNDAWVLIWSTCKKYICKTYNYMWLKMMPEILYKVHVKNMSVKPIIICG